MMVLNYVLCPECQRQMQVGEEAGAALKDKRGREYELECAGGHVFSIHDAVMTTRLHPSHYNVFWHIQGIERGQNSLRVGEWCTVKLGKLFVEIDRIVTMCYPEEDGCILPGVRSEAQYDHTTLDHFWLMTSGDEAEWGQRMRIDWTVYGVVPQAPLEIWRENLVFAARQLLSANYRASVLQSAAAVESFVYCFVKEYLSVEAGWRSQTIRDYINGKSRDSLPLNGVIQVCIREIMKRPIPEAMWLSWKRLRDMRNGLAHGDLPGYLRTPEPYSGQPFPDDKARARFAYETAVRFIYNIRYPDIIEGN